MANLQNQRTTSLEQDIVNLQDQLTKDKNVDKYLALARAGLALTDPSKTVSEALTTGLDAFTDANKRQMALYHMAYPEHQCNVVYASPKAYQTFLIDYEEIKYHQRQIKSVAFGLMKFLAISDDKEELASIIHPNYDSWTWSDYLKEQSSKKITQWSYK